MARSMSSFGTCLTGSKSFSKSSISRPNRDMVAPMNQATPPALDGLPPPPLAHADGLTISAQAAAEALEPSERRVDEIEMIGEEVAAGFRPPGASEVSAGMRYLHSSRTIHQLVTDRNRAVGLYLAVASLMWTASGALLNAKP